MTNKNLRIVLLSSVLMFIVALSAVAQSSFMRSEQDKKTASSDTDSNRITNSVEVLQSMMNAEDSKIPREMLQRAEAIAVIPHVIKGAFGIGGRYGKGLVAQRLSTGRWSAPTFVSIGGGSFGAQLGVSATDLVLVFTDKSAISKIGNGMSLKLGVDASVAAGPLGRSGEAGVTADLKSGIYAYSRSKGLFAGVSLDGAAIDIDEDYNHKIYGPSVNTKAILSSDKLATNASIVDFMRMLEKVPAKKASKQ